MIDPLIRANKYLNQYVQIPGFERHHCLFYMPSQPRPLLIIYTTPHHIITSTIVFLVELVVLVVMAVLVVLPNYFILGKDDLLNFKND